MERRWVSRLIGLGALAFAAWFAACYMQPPPEQVSGEQEFQAPAETQSTEMEENETEAENELPSEAATPGFTEQDLTPQPSPTPSATPSGGASPTVTAPGASPTTSGVSTGAGVPTATPLSLAMVAPAVPPDLISNLPLATDLQNNPDPARRVSMHIVEQAREAIIAGDPDGAIRLLGRGLSIDPTNPFIYFYLGRAYQAKHDYTQALTFWQRAAIGFASNPQWLGEAYGFEGLAREEMGQISQARQAYRQALAVAPANQLAQLGYARLGPPPIPQPGPGGETGGILPAPEIGTPAPAPEESPPQPAP